MGLTDPVKQRSGIKCKFLPDENQAASILTAVIVWGQEKSTLHSLIPGQGFDANSVGQLGPKGKLHVNVLLNTLFLFSL